MTDKPTGAENVKPSEPVPATKRSEAQIALHSVRMKLMGAIRKVSAAEMDSYRGKDASGYIDDAKGLLEESLTELKGLK